MAELLLAVGMDIDIQTGVNPSYPGYTPLHLAARFNQFAMVAYLVEHGAAINMRDKHGATPLGCIRSPSKSLSSCGARQGTTTTAFGRVERMRRRSALMLSGNGKAAVARGRYPRHIRPRHDPWPHTRINRRRATLTEPRIFRIQRGSQLALSLRLNECSGNTERWTATEKRNIVTDK
jgi:hypothetical protein